MKIKQKTLNQNPREKTKSAAKLFLDQNKTNEMKEKDPKNTYSHEVRIGRQTNEG